MMDIKSGVPLPFLSPTAADIHPSPANPQRSVVQRTLGYGSLFGEVSLITDSPYVSSAIAQGILHTAHTLH